MFTEPAPDRVVVPGVEEEQTVAMHWAFQYTAETVADMDEVDRNWNAIDASHGLVSIEHEIAAQHGLPRAMDDPRTSSKGLYILEGYHSLHCLVSNHKRPWDLLPSKANECFV